MAKQSKNRYITLQIRLLSSENFASLSAKANKLFLDMAARYNGFNNGDINLTFNSLKDRGWNSNSALNEAKRELLDKGWIKKTRLGGLNKCTLFAFTFIDVREFGGKLDDYEGTIASNEWLRADWQSWVPPRKRRRKK